MVDRRNTHYSSSLSHAQGMVDQCLALFDLWEDGQSASEFLAEARTRNLLNLDSSFRLRNVVQSFGLRFLREPNIVAAPFLKPLFATAPPRLTLEIILLYTLRQHGIFFDFMVEVYWPAVRANRSRIERSEIISLIDRGRINGKLTADWSAYTRDRVCGNVLGVAHDFELVGKTSRGNRPLSPWAPTSSLILYLAYDLHFLELSDDQVIDAEEWSVIGLERSDTIAHLHKLDQRGHLTIQDSGVVCRVDWKYSNRSQLNDALLRG